MMNNQQEIKMETPTLKDKLNTTRHDEVFNSTKLNPVVHIIGVGAVGSHLAYHIAKLGILDIRLYDFDKVEPHNLANQMFSAKHLDMNKAQACSEFLNEFMGYNLTSWHDTKVESIHDIKLESKSDVVFIITDTIESRKEIMEELSMEQISLVIETRMAVSHHETYCINPALPDEYELWLKSLPDEDVYVEVSACGSSLSVGATADSLATHAAWMMVHKLNDPKSCDFSRTYSFRDGSSSYRNLIEEGISNG